MRLLFTVLTGVILAANAGAGVIITMEAPVLHAGPGETASYSAVLTNNGPDPVYLNAASFAFGLPEADYLLTDLFFANVPISLAGGESSGTIGLFDIQVSALPAPPEGFYSGTYTLLGGLDSDAQELVGQVEFAVHVTPEPSGLVLLGIGALLVAVRQRSVRPVAGVRGRWL